MDVKDYLRTKKEFTFNIKTKEVTYIQDPSQAPPGVQIQQGARGGFYYDEPANSPSQTEPNYWPQNQSSPAPQNIDIMGIGNAPAQNVPSQSAPKQDLKYAPKLDNIAKNELVNSLLTSNNRDQVLEDLENELGIDHEDVIERSGMIDEYLEKDNVPKPKGRLEWKWILFGEKFFNIFSEARIYVKDPSSIPEGIQAKQGKRGGTYYEPTGRELGDEEIPEKKFDKAIGKFTNYAHLQNKIGDFYNNYTSEEIIDLLKKSGVNDYIIKQEMNVMIEKVWDLVKKDKEYLNTAIVLEMENGLSTKNLIDRLLDDGLAKNEKLAKNIIHQAKTAREESLGLEKEEINIKFEPWRKEAKKNYSKIPLNKRRILEKYWDDNIKGINSKKQFTEKNDYMLERKVVHNRIINELINTGSKKIITESGKPLAVILAGSPGSGKSSILSQNFDENDFTIINSDKVKFKMPEYDGDNSSFLHEESGDVADNIRDIAVDNKLNILIDGTLKTKHKAITLINNLKKKGYEINLQGVDVKEEECIKRAYKRFIDRERYVDFDFIGDTGDKIRDSIQTVKNMADKYEIWDNNVKKGEKPILMES